MTLEYKPRYPGGKVDPEKCKGTVYKKVGRFAEPFQCSKAPTKDGWCSTHHPDAEKERNRRSMENLNRELAARNLEYRRLTGAKQALALLPELEVYLEASPNLASDELQGLLKKIRAILDPIRKPEGT